MQNLTFNSFINSRTKISLLVVLIQIFLFISLSLIYPFIVKKFGYMGFVYNIQIVPFITVNVLVLFLILIGFFIKRDFIYAIWNIYLAYLIFPAAIGFYSTLCSIQVLLIRLFFMAVLLTFTFITFPKFKFYKFNINFNNNYYYLFFIALILILPFLYYLPFINVRNLLIQNIYETRILFRSISISWFDYIINPLVRFILPILFITSIFKKKYFLAFLSACMILYLYLCGSFRSYLVGFIAIITFFIGNFRIKPLIFISLLLFAIFLGYNFNDFFYLLDVGIRRFLFVPVHLEDVYFNTFSNNFLYWSHNKIGSLFTDYPFDRDLTLYVGEIIMNKPKMNANVGILIEGYLSLGYFGVFIHSILLGLFFSFIDSLNINPRYFGLVIITIFISVNSFFLSAIVTHGLLAFLIICFFFLKNTNYE